MTSRWFTFLLCLFLAVPLCCCGWHGMKADAETAQTEKACPMCQATADSATTEKEGCPCTSDLVQRDLATQAPLPAPPAPVFASLAETLPAWIGAPLWTRTAPIRYSLAAQSQGPPRFYLKHHALLC
jgi:hypothetical protein